MDDSLVGMCGGFPFRRQRVFVTSTQTTGAVWNAPIPMTTSPSTLVDSFDPVVAFDNCGRACVLWIERVLNVNCSIFSTTLLSSTSTDKGLTWSTPVAIDSFTSSTDIIEKPQIVAGTGSCDPSVSCILGVTTNLYATWMRQRLLMPAPAFDGQVMAGKTTDAGLTWVGFGITPALPNTPALEYTLYPSVA